MANGEDDDDRICNRRKWMNLKVEEKQVDSACVRMCGNGGQVG